MQVEANCVFKTKDGLLGLVYSGEVAEQKYPPLVLMRAYAQKPRKFNEDTNAIETLTRRYELAQREGEQGLPVYQEV